MAASFLFLGKWLVIFFNSKRYSQEAALFIFTHRPVFTKSAPGDVWLFLEQNGITSQSHFTLLTDIVELKQKYSLNEIETYISQFEPKIQERLREVRQLFFDAIPGAEESIRYKMPAYKVGRHHLYFAAYKKHIGFYPVYGLTEIEDEISNYRAKGTKDSLHFMHNKPLPNELIKKIIRLKSAQNR